MIQVEFKHRSVPAADRRCREHFVLVPQLRAVLLIPFADRHSD